MSYFLSDRPLAEGMIVPLAGEEAEHLLKSRRVRPGERFDLQDPGGRRFSAEVVALERKAATVRVFEPLAPPPPPPVRVTLLAAAVKDKAADLMVQKATEMGAQALVFFPAGHSHPSRGAQAPRESRSTRKPPAPGKNQGSRKNLSRWERIAWEACKQSGRQFPPAISVAAGLEPVLAHWASGGGAQGWLLQPGGAPPPRPAPGSGVHILVGPEGGFDAEENATALTAGFVPVGMGGNTLRAETAALAACALALFAQG